MRLRQVLADERGDVLLLGAVGMVAIVAFAGLAIDVGQMRLDKRRLQAAADAAAMAGALEISNCSGTAHCTNMQNAAKQALVENGFSASGITVVTQCGSSSATGVILTLNNGPCALGSKTNDPNYGDTNYVEAQVSQPQAMTFARVLGINSYRVSARGEAGQGSSQYCLYTDASNTSKTGGVANALLINGTATLTATCGIMDDSGASPALILNGGDKVTATSFDVVGSIINNGSNTVSPTPSTGASPTGDPLSYLTPPSTGGCLQSNYIANSGSVTLNAGTYCGTTIFNGGVTVTFNPGTYVFTGTVILNGGVNATGSGVTFYFSSGSWLMNGASHANLTAPTTGTYAGILMYQSSSDSTQMIVNGDTTSKYEGAIYAPAANLTLNGGSNVAAYTILDTQSVTVNGGVNFTLGADYSSLPGGSPIKGSGAQMAE